MLKKKCSIINVILSDLAVVNTLRKTTQISLFSKINSFYTVIQMSYEPKMKMTKYDKNKYYSFGT